MSHNIYVYKLDDKFVCGDGGDDNYYPTRVVVVVTPPSPHKHSNTSLYQQVTNL